MRPQPGETWQHFKGQKYRVLHVGLDTETMDEVVVYQQVKPTGRLKWNDRVWVRPLSMWTDTPTVKPDSTCHHSLEQQFLKNGKKWCQACLHAAKEGRFIRLGDQKIYVIVDVATDKVVTRFFSSKERAENAAKILNEPLRDPCFRVEERKLE